MAEYAIRLANGLDTAARMRRGDAMKLTPGGATLARSGLRPDGGGVVSITNGTMTATVQPFSAWIDGSTSDAQGGYPFVLDAASNLTVAAGHATLARVDTVVAQVRDNAFDASGFTDARVYIVQGSPGGSAPAVPATAIPLRDINVPAGASAGTGGLTAANLGADRRQYVAAVGGILPVASTTERDALTSPQAGAAVFRKDNNRSVDVYDGTAWRPVWVNPPAAKASKQATQSIADTSTTVVTWDTTEYAKGGATVAAAGITVPVAGVYAVKAQVGLAYAGPTGTFHFAIQVNGVTTRTLVRSSGWSSSAPTVLNGADDLVLAAGDVVTVGVFQSSAAARSTQGGTNYQTQLSVSWVSP